LPLFTAAFVAGAASDADLSVACDLAGPVDGGLDALDELEAVEVTGRRRYGGGRSERAMKRDQA
jgi:hypothetical protein